MTRFADPEIYACPACAAYFTRSGFRSINFIGTRDWSDGAPTAWWSVGQRPLVRCSSCAALFWIEDLQPLGVRSRRPRPIGMLERLWAEWRGDPDGRLHEERSWLQLPEGWNVAVSADTASFEDVVHVLANSDGLASDRRLWLRRCIWWTLNDRYRFVADGELAPNGPTWPTAAERANMEEMLCLLEMGELASRDLVQKGELLRLLGRFDEAISVLKSVRPDGQ